MAFWEKVWANDRLSNIFIVLFCYNVQTLFQFLGAEMIVPVFFKHFPELRPRRDRQKKMRLAILYYCWVYIIPMIIKSFLSFLYTVHHQSNVSMRKVYQKASLVSIKSAYFMRFFVAILWQEFSKIDIESYVTKIILYSFLSASAILLWMISIISSSRFSPIPLIAPISERILPMSRSIMELSGLRFL